MRNRTFATLGILALLAAASAFGQQRVSFDIPFEFHFANAVMPAGHYAADVSAGTTQSLLSLDCHTCQAHASVLTFKIGGGIDVPTEGRMVFNKYGDTYFLSEVWSSGRAQGSGLGKSKTERELARTTPDVARITVPSRKSPVIIASR